MPFMEFADDFVALSVNIEKAAIGVRTGKHSNGSGMNGLMRITTKLGFICD